MPTPVPKGISCRLPAQILEPFHWLRLFSLAIVFLAPPSPAAAPSAITRHQVQSVAPPIHGRTGFTSLPPQVTSIHFTNVLSEERSLTNQILLNGSGVAAGDVDGDGRCDLYFAGLDAANRLYRNLGNWTFEDITAPSLTDCSDQSSTGVALADFDGDDDLDLIVNGIARGTRLFLNDGKARFTEATDAWGLRSTAGASSLAIADVNGDGWLDLYVVHYRNDTLRDMPGVNFTAGGPAGSRQILTVNGLSASRPEFLGRFTIDATGGILEHGEADALFLNTGRNSFLRQPWPSPSFLASNLQPAPPPYDWGLSALLRDLNGDNAPDLYVCNDFQSPDRFWLNDGMGVFRAVPAGTLRQTSLFSMGADAADIDRDGRDDLFVADMLSPDHRQRHIQVMDATALAQIRSSASETIQSPRNTLFLQRSDGTYAEIAQRAGVDASYWSWCPAFLDVDFDGFEDLLITTGHWRDAQNADIARELDEEIQRRRLPPREQLRLRRRFPKLDTPNVAFRNLGDLTFEETGTAWGFDSRRISQGLALADLDDDGDLDVVVSCLNDGPLLLRNNAEHPRIAVRVQGLAGNSRGVGARIRVLAPGLPPQSQVILAGSRYLSSDDSIRSFAAGATNRFLSIEVMWPDGATLTLNDIPANSRCHVVHPALTQDSRRTEPHPPSAPTPKPHAPPRAPRVPLFEDASAKLNHTHIDQSVDDPELQPLLPRGLTTAGPAAAWFDFNGDGWEDLILGAGTGGKLAVFRNNTQGGFIPQRSRLLEGAVSQDLLGLLGWRTSATQLSMLTASDGFSPPPRTAPSLLLTSLVSGSQEPVSFPGSASAGSLSLADIDADGDLDVFVGGRPVPGQYPDAAPSVVLRNDDGRFTPDSDPGSLLRDAGLVNGSVFTDLDADGRPELALACEWGPVRTLRRAPNGWEAWNAPVRWTQPPSRPSPTEAPRSLADLTGLWTSINAGDFNADGRMDLILGNWGANSAHQRYLHRPLQLRYGGFTEFGVNALLEIHTEPTQGTEFLIRDRNTLGRQFPALLQRFPSFASFAAAPIQTQLEAMPPALHLRTAAVLDSILLFHRGDHFEAQPLPLEAQSAPVFGIAVADFNADGHVDAFLAQNFSQVHPMESPMNAGSGVLLAGSPDGPRTPIPTGVPILGDGRAAAAGDFDKDGRMDLVVTQNRGGTRLLRNVGPGDGIRIELRGPPGNLHAIGTTIRLEFAEGRLGPVHEVRSGAGYLSQDSPIPLPGRPTPPVAAHLQWPGGLKARIAIPSGAQRIEASIR